MGIEEVRLHDTYDTGVLFVDVLIASGEASSLRSPQNLRFWHYARDQPKTCRLPRIRNLLWTPPLTAWQDSQ